MLSYSFLHDFFLQQAADSTAEKDRQKPSMTTYVWPFYFVRAFIVWSFRGQSTVPQLRSSLIAYIVG